METSASFEARSAPSPYPTIQPAQQIRVRASLFASQVTKTAGEEVIEIESIFSHVLSIQPAQQFRWWRRTFAS